MKPAEIVLRDGDNLVCDVATLGYLLQLEDRRVRDFAQEVGGVRTARGKYDFVAYLRAYVKLWRDKAEGRTANDMATALDEAKLRKTSAEARRQELEIAELEGQLVRASEVETVVGEMADRVRARLINLPSTYGLALERLGVDAAKAEAVLLEIAEGVTRALREVADEVEAGDGDGESGDDRLAA